MTTAICNELADYHWLTSDDAAPILAELAANPAPLHTSVARLRDQLSPTRTHLALELVELRRRAAAKFAAADRMFFTRTGLEQATDQWVAAHKAQRFANLHERATPPAIVADLCCGIGGDLLAMATQGRVIAVDVDPIAAHLATANGRAALDRELHVHVAAAEAFDLDGVTAWHIDPDRRPTGRRTTSIEWCRPDRAAIEQLLARVPHAAIKLAPATTVPPNWSASCEREWISRDRECRQQVAWHGNLARTPGQRRATIVPTIRGVAIRTVSGDPDLPIPITQSPMRYLFDVDPAIHAAHLMGTIAAEHNLRALSAGPTYLTGDTSVIHDPALSCFEITDVYPFRQRTLARHLRAHGVGQLEIKKRGVDIDPEQLRRELNLRGDHAATLLLTRLAGRPAAILARRVSGISDAADPLRL